MAYYPYNFQPNYYGQPVPDQLTQLRQNQFQQQMPPPAQMMGNPQMQQPDTNGIIWVQGEAGAKAYLVAPGSTVQLWDSENQVIYLKSADMSGMPSMRILDYTERTSQTQKTMSPQVDWSNFITRDQLEEILSERLNKPIGTAKPKEGTNNG